MKNLDYSKNYKYSHEGAGHFIEQQFLPDQLDGTVFYDPVTALEKNILEQLKRWWAKRYKY